MSYPDHIDPTELFIIDLIVTKALADGWMITVYGDGELDLLRSTDYHLITSNIAACSETTLKFFRPGATSREGMVLLVHGNGCEVISDYTANPEIEALVACAEKLAEAYELVGTPLDLDKLKDAFDEKLQPPPVDPIELFFNDAQTQAKSHGFDIASITVNAPDGLTHRWEDGKIISERRWPRG